MYIGTTIAQNFNDHSLTQNGTGGGEEAPVGAYVHAKYSYAAQQPDELSFMKGDYIQVTEKSNDGWWKGKTTISSLSSVLLSSCCWCKIRNSHIVSAYSHEGYL